MEKLVWVSNGTIAFETVWQSLRKLNMCLPYDPTILLRGVYPKGLKACILKITCTHIFIHILTLYVIVKAWKKTIIHHQINQFISVSRSCLTICDPMDCNTPGFLSITNSRNLLKLMSIN